MDRNECASKRWPVGQVRNERQRADRGHSHQDSNHEDDYVKTGGLRIGDLVLSNIPFTSLTIPGQPGTIPI